MKCPICGESVGGARFAPHLEKCMKGTKRGMAKRNSNGDFFSSFAKDSKRFNFPALPTRQNNSHFDPHPNSTIIRIKLKDGCKICIHSRIMKY